MHKFQVGLKSGEIIVVEVEANNAEEAIEMAESGAGKCVTSYCLRKEFYKIVKIDDKES